MGRVADNDRLVCTCCGQWVITHVVYSHGQYLRVTHRGVLIGPGNYRTPGEAWRAVERWGGPEPGMFVRG